MTATAVAKTNPLRDELTRFTPAFEKLLPKWYPVDRLVTGAMVAAQTNPALARCTPRTVAVALARVAQWGLDVGDTAHLVPYGDTCTAIADYRGLIKLMVEAGARKVEAREVRKGDEFDYRYGSDPMLRHVPVHAAKVNGFAYFYAVVWLRGGVTQFEVMTVEEVEAHKQRYSKQWKDKPLEAWFGRKTLIRRLAKYIPKSPRLAAALADDETDFDPETGEVLVRPAIEMPATDDAPAVQGDAFEREDDGA